MHQSMAPTTEQGALIEFGLGDLPRSGMAIDSDPEIFLGGVAMMKIESVSRSFPPTVLTLPTKILNGQDLDFDSSFLGAVFVLTLW
jgi:hypothetical protein